MNRSSNNKPTIGIVLNSRFPGGSELAIVETVRGLHSAGYNLQVILPEDGPLTAYFQPIATEIHFSNHNWWASGLPLMSLFKRLWFIKGYYSAAQKMKQIILSKKIDIVISNSVVIPTGALAAKLAKVKHIWYLHEFGKEDHGLEFWYGQKRSFKIVNSLSDFCIANSQAVYDYFNRYIQANKLAKIFYACEMPATAKPERANFTESQQLNLIVTGRIAPGKGQLDAVKAVGLLRKNGIDARLSFQGTADENYLAEIKTYIEANGLVDHIHFLPYSSTPQDAVRKADVVLVCSRLEAFGRVTVEAMKLGVPIVATSTAGSLELIGEGNQRGLMYQPGDVDALVNHLISYHSNPELRYQKALLAHQYAWANCNLDFHTKQIEEIFNKI